MLLLGPVMSVLSPPPAWPVSAITVALAEANPDRVRRLEDGEVPIFESGLDELIHWARASKRLRLSHFQFRGSVKGAELVFLCLPTPAGEDGRADLSFVEAVVEELAHSLDPGAAFVVKSTVPPGTAKLSNTICIPSGAPQCVARPSRVSPGRDGGP